MLDLAAQVPLPDRQTKHSQNNDSGKTVSNDVTYDVLCGPRKKARRIILLVGSGAAIASAFLASVSVDIGHATAFVIGAIACVTASLIIWYRLR